ncbi:restriction endonuclease subunit S [Bacteroides cellulosilyticus]|uniref:Restriction endonuclease subunit S n=1 Tax=Bacteroides cellulosilyticus TaxID=246787 RepID=A0A5M6A439_9BACE|nr:restriction endonuclease subunit S [Bacteroides cellulosilyticus]KAA5404498.1 restriction endonuclease subunit S [Bacteroides cellulosilyticus]MDB1034640.1 restriction endonuclease subunit S [Phocaeicola vulgatus]MDB1034641.1 restriction endonuclease subunit S [Phocaeicola vulgatus]RYU14002.1 restriction endonuclease subunit S [Bacteroides cellulosilyticus]
MEELKTYRLADICNSIQTGPFGSQLHKSDYVEFGTPIVMPKDITNGKINDNNISRISKNDVAKLFKHKLVSGNIIYPRRGDISKCALITSKEDGWVCGTGCIKVDINQQIANSTYVMYVLCQSETVNWIESNAVGTTMLNLNTSILSDLPIKLPSLNTQKKLANIVSSFDKKIDLNRRINDNLEQQAQALFKSWFVENASYSGVSISEYFLPNRGKNLLVSDAKGGKTPVVAGGLTPSAFHNVANTKAPVITISASGANAGFVNLWGIPVWAADSSYIDSTIVSNIYFWYNLLKYNQKNIYESQTGSAQPHIYPKHIGNLLIPDLDMRKVECYESIVASMYLQINEIQQETKFLSDLRDTLLPKLISGELKINDLNC